MVDTDITEAEERNIELFFNELDNYIKNNILNEYVAYFFYELNKYNFSSLGNTPIKNYINSAIESFTNLNAKDVDLVKVKQILKEKYCLVLIEEPFSLKEI